MDYTSSSCEDIYSNNRESRDKSDYYCITNDDFNLGVGLAKYSGILTQNIFYTICKKFYTYCTVLRYLEFKKQ